jgi:hypothetical protein
LEEYPMKFRPTILISLLLATAAVGCSLIMPSRSGSGSGGGDDPQKEYQRKLDLYGMGQPCPENGFKVWGRATREDYGVVGMHDSLSDGKLEKTLWIGRSGEHAVALTCTDGVLISKVICGERRCIPCGHTRDCPIGQQCKHPLCQ